MINKIPPQAIDLEKTVLGAILLEKEAFHKASELITKEMFYVDRHVFIFEAMERIQIKSGAIDLVTVAAEMKADSEISFYLTSLTNHVVSSSHLLQHCQKIVECYLLRQLLTIGGNLHNDCYETSADPFDLIEGAEKALHALMQNISQNEIKTLDEAMIDTIRDLEGKRNRTVFLTGIPTGFPELDKATCGWQPTDLIILAARPKCGKTAFALNLALNAALNGEGVGFFSLEMSARQLVKRVLANKASMYLQSLRDARLDDQQMISLYQNGVQKLAGLDFFIDDTAALSVAEFKAKARRLVKVHKVKFLVVDYLQLMQPEKDKKNQNREQEVSTMARQLKIAAKELNVPILAISQLSREAEKTPVPQLSHLRESGAIEQDADMVSFLYKPTEAEINTDKDLANRIYFRIAAYRNGELSTIGFDFQGEYQRFEEVGKNIYTKANWKPVLREEDSFPDPF